MSLLPGKMLNFGFLQCCNTHHDAGSGNELKVVQLTSDNGPLNEWAMAQPAHKLAQHEALDLSLAPRMRWCDSDSRAVPPPATIQQQTLREKIRLPQLRRYPVPPHCAHDSEDVCQEELLRIYQEFVLDLHKGIYMTQLTSNQDYSNIHCQLLDDLQTLKVDQGSGCIVEFPLTAVSKVYRIVKNDEKVSPQGGSPTPIMPLQNAEHIVVVEFMRRKLAFVFTDLAVAQRFLLCIELLIRRAQESRELTNAVSAARPKGESGLIAPMFASHNVRDSGG